MISSPASSVDSTRRRVSRRTRLVAVVVAAMTLALLSACDASFNASTNLPYQAGAGINNRSGDVYTLNTLVVSDGDGNGTVVARLVNQLADDDTLVSFSATDPDGNELTTEPLASPITLASFPDPAASVQVGTDGALRLSGDGVTPGAYVILTFTFTTAAPIVVNAPVVAPGTIYADIPVGPAPTTADASG